MQSEDIIVLSSVAQTATNLLPCSVGMEMGNSKTQNHVILLRQTTVTAYIASEQLLLFAFKIQNKYHCIVVPAHITMRTNVAADICFSFIS